MNDLVKRLRDCSKNTTDRYMHELTGRAADHIEGLEAEIDEVHATGGCSYIRLEAANKRIKELEAVVEMVRDADNDCHKDGLQTIPPAARSRIDAVLGEQE
jgi:hypothetical protein